MILCDRQNGPPKMYVLIPGICDYVLLCSKRDFTGVIKVTDLNTGGVAWIIQVGPIESNEPFTTETFLWLEAEK